MFLGFLIFLISEAHVETPKYKYTIGTNPLSLLLLGGTPFGTIFPLLMADINFELKVLRKVSVDLGLTNVFLIIPIGLRVGVREYLGKGEFEGFYLHQGLGANFIFDEGNIIPPAIIIPYLTFRAGYKFVLKKGLTIDPFWGLTLWSKKLIFKSPEIEGITFIGWEGIRFGTIILWGPDLGVYLGYSW